MSPHLAGWTTEAIDANCRQPYGIYERSLREHYREYFETHPEFASDRPLKAKDIGCMLDVSLTTTRYECH